MKVGSILADKGHHVVTVSPDAGVLDAARLMRRENIGALVVTGADGSIKGILSERELTRSLATSSFRLTTMRVAQVMNVNVVTCTPEDSVASVMATMTHARARHVPVVEHGDLCGIVSVGDVVKSRLDAVELENRVLRELHAVRNAVAEPPRTGFGDL